MTFNEYLLARKPTSDALGDLRRLATMAGFPEIASREQLYTYIIGRHGNNAIGEEIGTIWRAYEVADRKSRKTKR